MSTASKRRKPLAVQRSDGTTSVVTGNRFIQTIEALNDNMSRGISSLTHPGIRLSHYVSVLRHKYNFPIHMEKTDQPSGIGWYGIYTLLEDVEIQRVDMTKPAGDQTKRASNPNTKHDGNEVSE